MYIASTYPTARSGRIQPYKLIGLDPGSEPGWSGRTNFRLLHRRLIFSYCFLNYRKKPHSLGCLSPLNTYNMHCLTKVWFWAKCRAIFSKLRLVTLLRTICQELGRYYSMYICVIWSHRTEDPVFESRQGVRFLGLYALQCWCQKPYMYALSLCLLEKNKCSKNIKTADLFFGHFSSTILRDDEWGIIGGRKKFSKFN
jgi:hypothetical protein